ncbi:MAG: sigma 54-interacting transcriptional regulator, partial [Planctomycetes bacterium]|nr:sigma 54-interacting transcriptional regulator [Planctomycetota bacterium]
MAKRTTPDQSALRGVLTAPSLVPVAAELLWRFHDAEDLPSYSSDALPTILSAVGGDFVALTSARGGQWTVVAAAGDRRTLPVDLLADVLDREEARAEGQWVATPLLPRHSSVDALVLHCGSGTEPRQALATVAQLTPVLCRGIAAVDSRQQDLRRIRRLEAMLEIANQWNQAREVIPLFVQMAQTATELLGADRASIFLWDRASHTLVGRPALGVEHGELRIPDDRGVVGQVIQTNQPMRVDAATEPKKIDHQVDSQLGYKTTTLLCVPMRSRSGELFGAFELINSMHGVFTAEDEAALIELAGHAAIALENAQDREKLLTTSRQITEQAAERVQLIGESPAIEALQSIIRRVANTDLAVMILGENGTGKEVVAQSIHYLSGRRASPFVAVNCAAIPDTLAESELFGHEEGAFTDARQSRK